MFVSLVFACFIFNVGCAGWFIIRAHFDRTQKLTFAAIGLGTWVVKVLLATRGHNYDLDSFGIVAGLVLAGKSVYAGTPRYNYGPLWGYFVAGLRQVSLWLPDLRGEAFHVVVAAFLGTADVALAALLAARYRLGAAIFFLCCPVTLLLTGYHSQFDNLALFAGISSWVLIRDGSSSTQRTAFAAVLLGVSLSLKHILFLFPVWVLLSPKMERMLLRIAYAAIAYGAFGLSFLPWLADPASRAGVIQHVFRYRSEFNLSLSRLIFSVHPFAAVSPAMSALLTGGWVALLLAFGIVAVHRKGDLLTIYLLTMFAFSPALVDQYLSLAILAGAMLFTRWPSWALAGTATLALFVSPANIFHVPFNLVYFSAMVSTQFCACVLLGVELRWTSGRAIAPVASFENWRRACTLCVCSFVLILLIFVAKLFATQGAGTAPLR